MGDCDCNGAAEWKAWHDRMPGDSPTLHVRGACMCPTPGYVLTLRRHEPQGTNPQDLLLDLVEREPSGVVPEVMTRTEVEYEESTDEKFDTVSIVPDGPVGIAVEEVS
jgi:hypothetical protein